PEAINPAIESAVADAQKLGIKGKKLTPFLLARIVELTGGDSLASNIALVKHNAALAAAIASAYASMP
ncbi:MAG: pseudouridine-5'-phosphate glycosidase, partial [Spirochaetales bacterium]